MKIKVPSNLKPPYLIHPDIIWTLKYVKKYSKNNKNISQLHLDFLSNVFGQNNLIFPSFNYDFPESKVFNVQESKSDAGYLSNYLIEQRKFERTKTPIFSFLTNISSLCDTKIDRPFNKFSVFDYLYKNDGTIVFYGATVKTCPYIHYVESQNIDPIYRYYKNFSGEIINNNKSQKAEVNFHVRPANMNLEYNFEKREKSLIQSNIQFFFDNSFSAVKARDLSNIWTDLMLNDKFYFLKDSCRFDIEKKYLELGRPFLIDDFE